MKRPPHRPRAASARDPLFNSSVQKALAMLESFGGERRGRSLAELAAGTRMTVSSAQRCTHTLVRLGLLKRDARARRWVLTPRVVARPADAHRSAADPQTHRRGARGGLRVVGSGVLSRRPHDRRGGAGSGRAAARRPQHLRSDEPLDAGGVTIEARAAAAADGAGGLAGGPAAAATPMSHS